MRVQNKASDSEERMFTELPLECIHATPDGPVSVLTCPDESVGWSAVLGGPKIAASLF